jgi:HEPN domain-containing protein
MNRAADWLHQARADLAQAELSADAGHHEWACFACHQAVEKALKALHLHHGQKAGGMVSGAPCETYRRRRRQTWMPR